LAFSRNQNNKLRVFSFSPLLFSLFLCYKQFTESRCVACWAFFATLVAVQHLNVL
jgi:hypothetical protein